MAKHEKKSRFIKWFSSLPKWRKLILCTLSALLSAAIIATSTLAIFGQLDDAIEVISGKYITTPAEEPYIAVNAGNTPKQPISGNPDPVSATLLATYIRNETDYSTDGNWKKQITSAISSISKYGFNCIIVPLNANGNKIYGGETDVLEYIIKAAEKKSIAVYGEYSLLANKDKRYFETEITSNIKFDIVFEYLDDDAVLAVEWSENIENVLPENTLFVTIEKGSTETERIFVFEGDERFEDIGC